MHPITLRFPRTNEEQLTLGPQDLEPLMGLAATNSEEPVELHCTAAQALEMLRYL
jgi:hypothetical protein